LFEIIEILLKLKIIESQPYFKETNERALHKVTTVSEKEKMILLK